MADQAPCRAVRREAGFGYKEPGLPEAAPVGGQLRGQADAHVQFALEHRVPDGQAPEYKRVPSSRLVVGEVADQSGRLGERRRVIEVRERHRGRAHERAVAGAASAKVVVRLRHHPHRG